MATPPSELANELSGLYTLERELGRGGMATVWLARDLRHDRPVALKLLHPELSVSLGAERFTQEIRLAARLQHPHILAVHDSGEAAGLLWFTMPYVEGESLRDRLMREGPLPVTEAVRLVREAALAHDYAHRHGVVHRDVKPENILVTDGQALVADFGIARALGGQTITSTGMLVGTPAYMSPEQASGETVDARTDVYALGTVLYELLAGEPPFTGPTAQVVLSKRLMTDAPPVNVARPGVPPGLVEVLARALQRSPVDRFPSASSFAEALAPFALPTTSGETAPVAIPRTSRSHPWWIVAVAALVLVVVGALAWRGWHAGRGGAVAQAGDPATDRRIAVLPFDFQGDSADGYFAEGMTDAVREKLIELPEVQVIARGSSERYRGSRKPLAEIARELGVRYLLTGTVRWAKGGGASQVLVSPELVEVSGDGVSSALWQKRFEAKFEDVFKVQSEIATLTVTSMHGALQPTDRPLAQEVGVVDAAAYEAYLRGQQAWSYGANSDPDALRKALPHFEDAVRRDSTRAEWWSELATLYATLFANGLPDSSLALKARQAVDRARALAPSSGRTLLALSYYQDVVLHDIAGALASAKAAERAQPGDPRVIRYLASIHMARGMMEEGLDGLRRSAQLDPFQPNVHRSLSSALLWLRRPAEAEAAAKRALELGPASATAVQRLAMTYLARGDHAGARTALASAGRDLPPARLAAQMATFWDLGWVLDDASQRLVLTLGLDAFEGSKATQTIVRAQQYYWRGDTAQARAWGDSARVAHLAELRGHPQDAQINALLGLALAYVGRRDDSHAASRRAIALTPAADPTGLAYYHFLAARSDVLLGEPDRAIDELEKVLSMPFYVSRGWLRIDPNFAPLRGHPRFAKLVAGD